MAAGIEYDFIVVGSGPGGAAVAYGLAQSLNNPKILVLEAGGANDDKSLRVDGQRWLTFLNQEMNWGYHTVPQQHAANRELNYSRGKGLGGSSAINFGVFTVGARADYDEWARIAGDDSFSWKNVQPRIKKLETFHPETPPAVKLSVSKYVAPRPEDHGSSGPLHVGFAAEWESNLLSALDVFEQAGFPLNPDHNSGNPIGASVLISSAHKGLRSTSADLIIKPSDNITIKTNTTVQRVIMDGKRAVGVEADGIRHLASKEVILSAGSLDTPRILMHSGIGPEDQLTKYNIPVLVGIPAIGQGLRDHSYTPIVYKRTPESGSGRVSFYGDKNKAISDAALKQWKTDGTGPWSKYACELGVGYFKLGEKFTSSPEFLALPVSEQAYLNHETVPHYEVLTHFPIHWFRPGFPEEDLDAACLLTFLYNSQAKGTAELQSSDPNVPLLFDPKFLEHEFDRRVAIDSLREVLRLVESPSFAKDTVGTLFAPPANATDEELLAYWQQTIGSSWHPLGTAKMGKRGDADAAVDKDFRVFGTEGLRVADMSVVPVLPSCHTQSVAYIAGLTLAEKLLKEYSL